MIQSSGLGRPSHSGIPSEPIALRPPDSRIPVGTLPAVRDTRGMKLYFAGPLFSSAEREWNAAIAAALRAAGHEVFLPQEQEPERDAPGIFAGDVGGLDWADALVAIMEGPDPDSGTAWEVGYAFSKKPIVLVRTDFRATQGYEGGYNAMLTQSATIRLDLPAASTTEVVSAVLEALERIRAA
jgi:nucleoside 2-deoxyribosyltransferase